MPSDLPAKWVEVIDSITPNDYVQAHCPNGHVMWRIDKPGARPPTWCRCGECEAWDPAMDRWDEEDLLVEFVRVTPPSKLATFLRHPVAFVVPSVGIYNGQLQAGLSVCIGAARTWSRRYDLTVAIGLPLERPNARGADAAGRVWRVAVGPVSLTLWRRDDQEIRP